VKRHIWLGFSRIAILLGNKSLASGGKDPQEPKDMNAPDDTTDADSASSGDIGAALRSAYQATVNEEIPSEMLDLLGKLD